MYTWNEYSGSQKHKTWGVFSPKGELVCVCAYKKGAVELTALLNALKSALKRVIRFGMKNEEAT